jgi:hypothetical protein
MVDLGINTTAMQSIKVYRPQESIDTKRYLQTPGDAFWS